MGPDFAACGANFTAFSYPHYTYNGSVPTVFAHEGRPKLITYAGCRQLCGTGTAYYSWSNSSQAITTWVLPIVGVLVQAPYESNAFLNTFFALARWVGSPMATLAYTLWNIKVTAKCAMMVDMATRYDIVPGQDSAFGRIRDSFFILSVMNQYSIKERMPAIEAEKLLRIALFSDTLRLSESSVSSELVERRRKLAQSLRERRKRAVVPVFFSFMWFFFALAISVQAAFGQLGSNKTAHDLALGLLMSWLPVLILVTIVDRNPIVPEAIRRHLNDFVDDVRIALLDPHLQDSYMRETHREPQDFAWMEHLRDEDFFRGNFFASFAGQGRLRWHYGVAHSVLAGIETRFMAKQGRDWLRDEHRALTLMVNGPRDGHFEGLRTIDFRMLWQIMSSVTIVVGTASGAFIVSYLTPTVGLGCRSGGYLIYIIMASLNLVIELIVWWSTSQDSVRSWIRRRSIEGRVMQAVGRRISRRDNSRWINHINLGMHEKARRLSETSFHEKIELLILRPLDIVSSAWLVYIMFVGLVRIPFRSSQPYSLAQTLGSYQTCECMSSVWGWHAGHGYMDFETYDYYRSHGVAYSWGIGTALSTAIMSVAFAFTVVEWCTQSHLNTEDYEDAMQGLRRTRRFKKYTAWLRDGPNFVIELVKRLWFFLLGRRTRPGTGARRSLIWTWQTKEEEIILPIIEGEVPHDQEKATQGHVEMAPGQVQVVQEGKEPLAESLLGRNPDAIKRCDRRNTAGEGEILSSSCKAS